MIVVELTETPVDAHLNDGRRNKPAMERSDSLAEIPYVVVEQRKREREREKLDQPMNHELIHIPVLFIVQDLFI